MAKKHRQNAIRARKRTQQQRHRPAQRVQEAVAALSSGDTEKALALATGEYRKYKATFHAAHPLEPPSTLLCSPRHGDHPRRPLAGRKTADTPVMLVLGEKQQALLLVRDWF